MRAEKHNILLEWYHSNYYHKWVFFLNEQSLNLVEIYVLTV